MRFSLLACSTLILMLCGLLLAGCGQPTSSFPRDYVFTDANHLLFLTWHQQGNQLSGDLTALTYSTPVADATAQLQTTSSTSHGTLQQNQQITLTVGTTTTLTGQLEQNGSQLRVTSTTGGDQQTSQIWSAISQQDAQKLVSAFKAYEQLQGALTLLASDITPIQLQTVLEPLAEQVRQARGFVTLLEGKLAAIQQDLSEQGRCQRVSDFLHSYPTNPGTFQLISPLQNSVLAHDLLTARAHWATARGLILPRLVGLSLPWYLPRQDVTTALQRGQYALNTFQTASQQDEQDMTTLKQQYDTIGTTVQTIKQSC